MFSNTGIPHRVRNSTLSDITTPGSCDCPGLTDLSGGAVMLWRRPRIIGPVGHVELDVWKRRHLLSQSPASNTSLPPPRPKLQTYPTAPGVPVAGASWFSHWGVKKTPSAGLRQVAMLVSVTHLWEFAPAFGREKGDWHGHLCRTSHLLGDARQRWGGGGSWGDWWRGLTGPHSSSHTFYSLIINAWVLAPGLPVPPLETSY